MRVLAIGFLFAVSAYAASVENLRKRLESGIAESEETALKEIIAGGGDATLLEQIEKVGRRRCSNDETRDISFLAIRAISGLQTKHPEAGLALFSMITYPDAETEELAVKLFLKDRGTARAVISAVHLGDDIPAEDRTTLMKVLRYIPTREAVPLIARAIVKGDHETTYYATLAIEALQESGVSTKEFAPLRGALKDVIIHSADPHKGRTYSIFDDPRYSAAQTFVNIFGADPEVVRASQKILAAVRQHEKRSPEDEQQWMDIIKAAQGRPTTRLDWVASQRRELNQTLEQRQKDRRSNAPPRIGSGWDRRDAKAIVGSLLFLEKEEAAEYIDQFMRLKGRGNRALRAQLAHQLTQSEDAVLKSLAGEDKRCLVMLRFINAHPGILAEVPKP